MAEERRLFYVGVTRAKDRLYLSYAFQRMNWGRLEAQTPSRFLAEIPTELFSMGSSKVVPKRSSQWSWESERSKPKTKSYGQDDPFGAGRSVRPMPSRGSTNRRPKPAGRGKPRKSFYADKPDPYAPKKKVRTSIPDAARLEARQSKNEVQQTSRPQKQRPSNPAAGKSEIEYKTGDRVMHPKFGQGIVMSSKLTGVDEEVTIAFTQEGVKRLVASMAKLEKI